MASIQLKNLVKRYENGFEAVRDVNLQVDDGEFVALVGPSGCGKSTTLRMIAGLEEISDGTIEIGGRIVNDIEPGNRDIAMVFQNYALYPHMTVRQNMSFGLKMRKTPRAEIEQRVKEASEVLSIEALLDRRPRELSGGQRQRVAVGRAIVRQPMAFLFDEPLSNLDAKLRVQMRTELARLHQRLKTTTIYVTHDQVEAMTLGDRIVVMKDGVIQQVDSPLNIYRRPANRFVAGFIGSPSMNFISGELDDGTFVSESIRLPTDSPVSHLGAILGVRPEDISADPSMPKLADVQLEVIERMGHESIVYFTLTGAPMIARLKGNTTANPGDTISLHVNPDALHLFESSGDQNRVQ